MCDTVVDKANKEQSNFLFHIIIILNFYSAGAGVCSE